MSYAGSIDHDVLLRAGRAGYFPEVRVWLQEIGPGGRGGRLMRRLEQFDSVTVHREVNGMGRAVVTLSNRGDRFFRKRFDRVSTLPAESSRYFKDMLGRTLPYVRPLNPDRQDPRDYARSAFGGARRFVSDQDISDYVRYIYDFTGAQVRGASEGAGARPTDQVIRPNRPGTRGAHDVDLVDLGLLQRVAIDVKGQDGLWYARFTGVVTGIDDTARPGEPVVALQCRDYWRLVSLSQIALRGGPEAQITALDLQLQADGRYGEFTKASISLQDLSGPQILHRVLDITNQSLCWLPFAMHQQGLNAYRFDDASLAASGAQVPRDGLPVDRGDFFQDEGFWQIPFQDREQVAAAYLGAPTLRTWAAHIHQYGAGPHGTGDLQDKAKVVSPGRLDDDTTSFPVAALESTLLVDANITSGNQARVYRQMIDGIMGLYQIDRVGGDQLIKKVTDATMYDALFSVNGDLVYQIPKYNNLPGDYAVTFARTKPTKTFSLPETAALPTKDGLTDVPETDTVSYGTFRQDGGPFRHFDYAPNTGHNFAWRFHGFNYVLTDVGQDERRISSGEELLITDLEVPGGADYFSHDQVLQSGPFTGRTSLGQTRQLQARFGHRFLRASQVWLPQPFQVRSDEAKQLLNGLALASLQQLNGRACTGHFASSLRPDLDIGLTALLLERQLLFMILSTEETIKLGDKPSHQTTLQLGFGHDFAIEIPNPWLSALSEVRLPPEPVQSRAPTAQETASQVASQSLPQDEQSFSSGVSVTSGEAFGGQSLPPNISKAPDNPFEFRRPGEPLRGLDGLSSAVAIGIASKKVTTTKPVPVAGSTDEAIAAGKAILYVPTDEATLVSMAQSKLSLLGRSDLANLTLDEYTLARVIASEADLSTTTLTEQVLTAYTLVFEGRNGLFRRVTSTGRRSRRIGPPDGSYLKFGNQQDGRFQSTAVDPTVKHVLIARAVLASPPAVASPVPPGTRYFGPRSLRALRLRGAVPASRTSVQYVKDLYKKSQLAWMKIDDTDVGAFMAFVPAKVDGSNIYDTRALDEALATVRKYDP